MSQTPTLLDMPDPPSNPDTPSEMPGTPNSTTTSLSALSTTAIKDGHRGAPLPGHHGQHLSANMLEAERADRISRLAGLERVVTARQTGPGGAGSPSSQVPHGQIPGYFDANGNPVYTTKMSTVGSASATGSVGGGHTTTWDSGSTQGDDDEGGLERDGDERDVYSQVGQSEDGDGMSDEGNASLVGFGEGAGSTVSGPTYNASRTLRASQQLSGTEGAERIAMDRSGEGEGRRPGLGSPEDAGVGKFYYEDKK